MNFFRFAVKYLYQDIFFRIFVDGLWGGARPQYLQVDAEQQRRGCGRGPLREPLHGRQPSPLDGWRSVLSDVLLTDVVGWLLLLLDSPRATSI